MVLTQFRSDRQVRLVVRGTAAQLEPIGLVLRQLFPGEVLVSSDESSPGDDLDDIQLEVLEDIADYYREMAVHQCAPAC